MIERTRYICEKCKEEFSTKDACEAHEKLCELTYYIGEMSYDDNGVSFQAVPMVRASSKSSGIGLFDGPVEILCRTLGKTPQEVRKSCINALRTHCEFARRRYAKAVKALDKYRKENENV